MAREIYNGKTQRAEELLTDRDRAKIHELYKVHLVNMELLAERYSLDVSAVAEILRKPAPKVQEEWRVRWDDENGESFSKNFKTFGAAKLYASRLQKVEWKKVERV